MTTPLITVIVPVYNIEKYLDRCVNSIRNQTYKNLEILLVDDGSTDRSGEMCDAFAAELAERFGLVTEEKSKFARALGLYKGE